MPKPKTPKKATAAKKPTAPKTPKSCDAPVKTSTASVRGSL